MQDLLTIVIPCYNEELYIGRTLRHIKRQLGTDGVRIIISDAGSVDSTLSIIEKLKNQLDLRVEVVKGGLPAVGRNAGADLATTPYLLFIDADITFTDKTVISRALACLQNEDFAMVGTCPKYRGEFDFRAKLIFSVNRMITWYLSKTKPFAIGGFILVRRLVFLKLGGFDEKAHQSEDWLLSRQIEPKKFRFMPDLITQDNRRFKRYGYFKMIGLVFRNWLNRNNKSYFYKDQNYWR